MKILNLLLLGGAGYLVYKAVKASFLTDDEASKQLSDLMRQITAANEKGDGASVTMLSDRYAALQAKYPNASVAKYM